MEDKQANKVKISLRKNYLKELNEMSRYTPDNIQFLKENEYFVFGSNEAGIHGGGAARLALDKFNAQYGKPFGFQGNSFAIPTKDRNIETLPLENIKEYIALSEVFFEQNPDKIFYVTKIGCGLAGLTVAEVAPLFNKAYTLENVYMPKEFFGYFGLL